MDESIEIKETLKAIRENTLLAAKNVLTFEDVMLLTGFSKNYLYQLMSRHVIPFSKPNGRKVFFDRKALEEWLLSNPVKPDAVATNEAIINDYINS